MSFLESNNSYGEASGFYNDDLGWVQVNTIPDREWLNTEDGQLIITETLYAPQVVVEFTDFLVVG